MKFSCLAFVLIVIVGCNFIKVAESQLYGAFGRPVGLGGGEGTWSFWNRWALGNNIAALKQYKEASEFYQVVKMCNTYPAFCPYFLQQFQPGAADEKAAQEALSNVQNQTFPSPHSLYNTWFAPVLLSKRSVEGKLN